MKTLLLTTLVLASTTFAADANKPVTGKEAFAQVKSLVGRWTAPPIQKGWPRTVNVFRITAGGSAVEETIFPGTKMEMVTMYHLDTEGELVLTHYCMLGNQPRFELDEKYSTPTRLVFKSDGGDVKRGDTRMGGITLTFAGKNRLDSSCTSYEKGKPSGEHVVHLSRAK